MAKMPSAEHIRHEAALEGESYEHERAEYEAGARKRRKRKTGGACEGEKGHRRLDRPGRARRQAGGMAPATMAGAPQGAPGAAPGQGAAPNPQQQQQMMQQLAMRRQMQQRAMVQQAMAAQGAGAGAGAPPQGMPPGAKRGGKTPNFHPGGKKGKLHNELGIPESEKIGASRLAEAAHSKNPEIRRDAIRAQTMSKWHHTGPKKG